MDCVERYSFKWNQSSILKIQYSDTPGWKLKCVIGQEGVSDDGYVTFDFRVPILNYLIHLN